MASKDTVEPETVSEALHGPHSEQWREAMQEEIDSLQKHDVYELTELPRGRKAVGCKWVFEIKHNLMAQSKDIRPDLSHEDILRDRLR